MTVRIFCLVLGAIVLSSCAEEGDPSSRPKMQQVQHTSPMGQTTYTYRPVDGASGQ